MLFPSLEFCLFFAVLFLLYYYIFTRARDRKLLLVFANFVFYSYFSFAFAVLMFVFTLINWFFALRLKDIKNYLPRKFFLIFATIFNIAYLLYFKEAYNAIDWLNSTFPSLFTDKIYLRLLSISAVVPLGVSYYVFKCLSYIFEVYTGRLQARKSPFDVLLYVSFFPQVLSGPIVKAHSFFEDFEEALQIDRDKYNFLDFDRASLLIMRGLIKKNIVATFLTLLITKQVFAAPMNYNTIELIFAALSYSVVIYADFSGYSDMSIGIALLLGFKSPVNFARPYTSKSVTDFWRRWHISFSSWLRDYVYFSFGGSRFGIGRTVFALLATMIIAALWHGFKYSFLIWGLLHGFALAVERILKNNAEKKAVVKEFNSSYISVNPSNEKSSTSKKSLQKSVLKTVLCFLFISCTWIFFRAENLSEAVLFFTSLKNFDKTLKVINPFCVFLLILSVAFQFIPDFFCKKAFKIYSRIPVVLKALVLAFGFLLLQLFTSSGISEFIYFKF